jgi:FHA domain
VDHAYIEIARDGQRQLIALDSDRFTVGRAAGNDLCLAAESTVSGQHAVVERAPHGWMIRDLGSSNGTFVNRQRVSEPRQLESGDAIALGGGRLVFRLLPAATGPARPPDPGGYLDVTEEWHAVPGVPPAAVPVSPPPVRPAMAPPAGPAPSVPASAAVTAVAAPAPSQHGHVVIRGTARAVKTRRSQNEQTILLFRVERYDPSGNRLPPVGVEFAGYKGGQLSEGEEVEVAGRWKRGTLRAYKVFNLTTSADVRGMSKPSKALYRVLFVLICLFIVFCAVFAFSGL